MLLPVVTRAAVGAGVLTTPATGNAWQIGTLLNAVALTATRAGSVRLQIGARVVDASTDLKLKPGQSLHLRVSETGRRVVLRTENPDDTAARVREGIRSALPRQALQAPLLATAQRAAEAKLPLPAGVNRALEAFTRRIPRAETLMRATTLRVAIQQSGTFLESRLASGHTDGVARDWKSVLLQLRERLVASQPGQVGRAGSPARSQAPPTQPQTAAAPLAPRPGLAVPAPSLSGTGPPAPGALEAAPRPARDGGSGAGDPSSAGRQFALPASKPAPPPLRQQPPVAQPVVAEARLPADLARFGGQLIEQVDAALARVRLNQLASAPTDSAGQRTNWLVELPVRHGNGDVEVVPLTIEREGGGGGRAGGQAVWAVNLVFEMGGAALRARIAMRGDRVYTSFWAGQGRLRMSVEKNLGSLRQALESKRVRVGCLTCSATSPEPPASSEAALLETSA